MFEEKFDRKKFFKEYKNELSRPGTYVLIFYIKKPIKLRFKGKENLIEPGHLLYFGSARNGLVSRLKYHLLKQDKKKHWHVDWLTTNKDVEIEAVGYNIDENESECKISQHVLEKKLGDIVIKKFGSTDCKCITHLFHVKSMQEYWEILQDLNEKGWKFHALLLLVPMPTIKKR